MGCQRGGGHSRRSDSAQRLCADTMGGHPLQRGHGIACHSMTGPLEVVAPSVLELAVPSWRGFRCDKLLPGSANSGSAHEDADGDTDAAVTREKGEGGEESTQVSDDKGAKTGGARNEEDMEDEQRAPDEEAAGR